MNKLAATNLLSIPDPILTRIFNAPRALVWKAWTDPKLVAEWWGPQEFTNPRCEWDARPGGKILVHMHGPKGSIFDFDMPMNGVFHEVVSPRKLVFTSRALQDANGNDQLETLVTISLDEIGGKTKLTLHVIVIKSSTAVAGAFAGMEQGWSQSFEKLIDLLEEIA